MSIIGKPAEGREGNEGSDELRSSINIRHKMAAAFQGPALRDCHGKDQQAWANAVRSLPDPPVPPPTIATSSTCEDLNVRWIRMPAMGCLSNFAALAMTLAPSGQHTTDTGRSVSMGNTSTGPVVAAA